MAQEPVFNHRVYVELSVSYNINYHTITTVLFFNAIGSDGCSINIFLIPAGVAEL